MLLHLFHGLFELVIARFAHQNTRANALKHLISTGATKLLIIHLSLKLFLRCHHLGCICLLKMTTGLAKPKIAPITRHRTIEFLKHCFAAKLIGALQICLLAQILITRRQLSFSLARHFLIIEACIEIDKHIFSLSEVRLIGLARLLSCRVPRLIVLGMRGSDLRLDTGLSKSVMVAAVTYGPVVNLIKAITRCIGLLKSGRFVICYH